MGDGDEFIGQRTSTGLIYLSEVTTDVDFIQVDGIHNPDLISNVLWILGQKLKLSEGQKKDRRSRSEKKRLSNIHAEADVKNKR